ncbi:MAG: NAD(P)H-dependent glycerol-3-phosphate dehydrogenase [Dehalococcoidia bacterium]|nr:NAD(P)H-dependent glycerol-3-phosphate dehydrogenase [Dehalococcoidia bacterium]
MTTPHAVIDGAAVVGTTAWGTMLAVHLARTGLPVTLVARSAEEAQALEAGRCHVGRLPGVPFPEALHVDVGPPAVAATPLVCFAVPSRTVTANAEALAAGIDAGATVLSATKGIEPESGRRMSQLLETALPGRSLAVLSGPNLAKEIAAGLPSTTVIASRDGPLEALRRAFHTDAFRVYTTDDVPGVELGGALKNVIAIAGGMVDTFGYGHNAKAAILTRGLAEMTRLGVAAGAAPITFQGLAGVGDLMATAYSPLSRNRRLGELVAGGVTLARALDSLGETAEGATTVPAALVLARSLRVEMPITEGLHGILYGGLSPADAVRSLMLREPKPEFAAGAPSAAEPPPAG